MCDENVGIGAKLPVFHAIDKLVKQTCTAPPTDHSEPSRSSKFC